ncbi:cytochrome c biogenesis protein ResB [Streptomyces sp. DSM 44915]|uniref:Cytochrome c biogenesis protein ResB n=1 Tax=Streptomyces chisholmiae TaxID=3075540 RepID=A0ABU2K019_9ACTN|nr:cytochrome c biogenesis protein ResB [Streptomyces sp. DSM 44915]MDT0270366.1 cytochrome c biogenesis protein ResB [Streptomyces sp. DSM 44915]
MTEEGASRTGAASEPPTEPAPPDGPDVPEQRREEESASAGLTTAPLDADQPAGPAGTAVPGSFAGTRAPGVGGALSWLARELLGWARWFWRQLTSMRVALLLLLLLALASIPGSLIPQQRADAALADDFRRRNPGLSQLYDRLQLFEVYSSVWFSAIYLLLFISLIGCILPRTWQFVGQLRGRPPRAPRRLDRMPAYTTWRTATPPDEVLAAARRRLRRRRFRTDLADTPGREGQVAAEKGFLREAGNLLFHLALLVMLIAFAAGQLYHSEGGKLVVEGTGFTNALPQYDDFSAGQLYDVDELERFGFTLDRFHYEYSREGIDIGTPTDFRADITYWTDDGTERSGEIAVNHPLRIGDAKVRLLGHGYAPVVTVTDAEGNTAYQGPVPFLPQDNGFTSTGVIKVPSAVGPDGERDQLGFQGFFNPTYNLDEVRGPHSTFPEPDRPMLTLNAFHGDLGISAGLPQNVYQLDTENMEQLTDESGDLFRFDLMPGQSIDLPDGRGTLTFERFENWATFQIASREGNSWALIGALAAILGLVGSLFLQRRRVWVRARTDAEGLTVVEMASLGRTESHRVPEELAELAAALQPDAPMEPEPTEGDAATDAGGDGAGADAAGAEGAGAEGETAGGADVEAAAGTAADARGAAGPEGDAATGAGAGDATDPETVAATDAESADQQTADPDPKPEDPASSAEGAR